MQVTRIASVLLLSVVLRVSAQPTAPGPAAPAVPPSPAPSAPAPTVSAVNTRSISLQQVIDMALQHNLDIQIQRFLPDLSRFDIQGAYGAYDPVLFASGRHSYRLDPGGLDAQNRPFQGNETDVDSFSTGLSGLLPWGLRYSVTGNASDAYGTRPGALLDERIPFENSTANAAISELRQPLLRDFWIDNVRATIRIARNRMKYSELTLRQQIMNTVTAVEQAYFNLIFARENVKVQETALQLAERLLWENRKKVEVGQLAPLDEKQAESQVAASRADLLATQRALDAQENILKSLITDDYRTVHEVRMIPAESLVAVPGVLNLQDSWERAFRLRPDLLQARLDVQRSEINVRLDRNQLLPQLDLVGQYGYTGSGREYTHAIGQVRETDNPYWFYGAQISIPLGNRAARANYKSSKVLKEQAELLLKRQEQVIYIEIDDAVKRVQTDFSRVEATREARLFAEAALEAEQKKLENGKSTSFFVLQFQRDLTAARFQEIQALAEYNVALSVLALREGATLERHHLTVEVK